MSAYVELYGLVESLTRKELKALTLHIERTGGKDTDYNTVLEIVKRQRSPDEQELKQAVSSTIAKRLPAIQTKLMSLVATVLVDVHEELRPIKVDNAIQKSRILLYKGHHKMAVKVMNKAIKLAETYHMYAKLVQLYALKLDTFRSAKNIPGDTYASNKEILQRQAEILQYLQDYNQLYDFFFEQVVAPEAYLRREQGSKEWRSLLNAPVLNKDYSKKDIRARMMRLNILMVIAVRAHESELAAKCIEDIVNLVLESDVYSLMFANSYSQNLVSLIEIQLDEMRDYERAAENIQHLKAFVARIGMSDHLPSVQQYYKAYAGTFAMVFEQRLALCMRRPPTQADRQQLLTALETSKEMIPVAMKSLRKYVALLGVQIDLVEGNIREVKNQAANIIQDMQGGGLDDFQKVAVFAQAIAAILEHDWNFAESLLQKVLRWEGPQHEQSSLRSLYKAVESGATGISEFIKSFDHAGAEVQPLWVREIDIAYVLTQWFTVER